MIFIIIYDLLSHTGEARRERERHEANPNVFKHVNLILLEISEIGPQANPHAVSARHNGSRDSTWLIKHPVKASRSEPPTHRQAVDE